TRRGGDRPPARGRRAPPGLRPERRGRRVTAVGAGTSHPPATPFRDSQWGSQTYVWADLESFLGNTAPKDGVHAIHLARDSRNLTYEFYFQSKPGKALVAHFHGNAPRRENDLPMITGLGVTSD